MIERKSSWDKGRKIGQTGIQYLGIKDLWPTGDERGENLRKAMLAAVKAEKKASYRNLEWIREMQSSSHQAAAEVAAPKKKAPVKPLEEMSKEELEEELSYGPTLQDADYLRKLLERKRAETEPETEAAVKLHRQDAIPEGAYNIGDEYYWNGFKAKVTGIERLEGKNERVLLEYIEGPLKGEKEDAPAHLKDLQNVLVEPFDLETTQGTVRITADWSMDPESYMEIYTDRIGAMMNIELHGPNLGAPNIPHPDMPTVFTSPRGRFRSAAGVPIEASSREQLKDPVFLKETAIRIANSVLGDHFGVTTRIVGRPPDTMTEVLELSRDPTPDAKALNKIKITVELGDEKISHMAKWWVDAYDKRLEQVAKLRTCV